MLAYTVIATLPDEAIASEYTAWLVSHTREVVAAGALASQVVRIDEPSAPIQVESRYLFASRAEYDRYLRDHAPALRSEGLSRFGPERGVVLTRRVGRVV